MSHPSISSANLGTLSQLPYANRYVAATAGDIENAERPIRKLFSEGMKSRPKNFGATAPSVDSPQPREHRMMAIDGEPRLIHDFWFASARHDG